jgi:uncharacterized glyoxalase superfamily protein PhnB
MTETTQNEAPMTDSTTTPPTSGPAPTVWHSLVYDDAPAAIAFLTSAFGFVAKAVYYADDEKTQVAHAQLDWPAGGGIMLGSGPRPDGWPDGHGRGSAYCVTDDPDGVYTQALAAGATVLREIRDEDYGGRGFTVADPEGNQWSFGSYRGE